MLALPIDYPPVRVADTYSADETALARVVSKKKVVWDSGLNIGQVASGRQLPSNDWGAFIFPSLLRNTVYYNVLSTGTAALSWTQNFVKNYNQLTTTFQIEALNGTMMVEPAGLVPAAGQLAPHGNFLFCGKADNRVGFWVDAMDPGYLATITVTLSAALPTGASCAIVALLWTGARWTTTHRGSINAGGTFGTVIIHSSGYWAIELAFSCAAGDEVANPSTFTMTMESTTTSCWSHRPVTDLFANVASIGNERILGCAFLLQNEASVMNKQGNVVAMQAPPNRDWYTTYAGNGGGANFYSNVFADKSATTFLLETGCYGFKRPKSSQDFAFEQEVNNIQDAPVTNTNETRGDSVC